MLRDLIAVGHIFFVIAWMSGLLYLPRLFAYHVEARLAGETGAMGYFATMERRLFHIIMMPSMVGVWIFGWLLMDLNDFYREGWLHGKLLLVFVMTFLHFYLGHCRAALLSGVDRKSARFYKLLNELPAVILVLILILVVLKPF